ncbi:MAG: CBS domain-containing protein [Armatimonadota bacterium]
MNDKPVANLIRSLKTVAPEDSIGRAVEYLRVSGLSILPVVSMGKLVGVITEESLLKDASIGDPVALLETRVSTHLTTTQAAVYAWSPVAATVDIMDKHRMQAIPVVNEYGDYLGMVSRSDLLGDLTDTIKPTSIAGMATPLGVYLTTGVIRAGAGDLGLFLTGVSIMAMNYLALGIVFGLAWVMQMALSIPLWDVMVSSSPDLPAWADSVRIVMYGLSLPAFLLLMRLSPFSGFHAAEHQVVHAIENGEPLKPEYVSNMPRVHPRCGTNIVAAMIIFLMISQIAGTEIALMITVLVLAFAWKNIGGLLQNYITTKPASKRQMANGISAGESLLKQFRANPTYNISGWKRIWLTGMPQMMLGAASAVTAAEFVQSFLL